MRKTEIYGTIGPACAKQEILTEMFRLGMTGIRLNMSHTELEDSREWTEMITAAAGAAGVRPRLLIDLRGPELRIGNLLEPVKLREGERICLQGMGDEKNQSELQAEQVRLPAPGQIFDYLQPGQEILLDDGKLKLEITEVSGKTAFGRIIRGGILQSKKSIALPGIRMHLPVLTESDRRNIRNAKSHGVTGVMQPFVQSKEDLQELKRELEDAGASDLEVFAKIENMEGAEHLEELLSHADQIVIARGDLGNSMPLWELPAVQEEIAVKCRNAGKPFMVVTQMLASMEKNPVPTRAEVSDIFRAVQEGAASVMVTGETAAGNYPAEAIRYLANTVRAAEKYLRDE
ncbi:MAG: pyruvate kinase [Lachnospiraceae bacterium]|nr:pyruvate kinase [Lachnospiraceae bacterium]